MLFSGRRLGVRPPLISTITNSFFTASALPSISTVAVFGSNPGALRMHVYAPARLWAGRPLVVVLHGCRQDAASFANDAGWIAIAQQFRVALLLPEQTYENNKGRCFNWFRPDDGDRPGIGGSCRFSKGQVCVGDTVESMPKPGAERAVVDCAADLEQQISAIS
jgi:poly(3-hydroxybutyrate) depolymerase